LSVEIVEEGGKKYAICPHCGNRVEKFIMYGRGPNPFCPKCNKLVSKKLIPDEFIERRPYKHPQKSKKKEMSAVSEQKMKTVAPRIQEGASEGLFRRPRESHEILEEILRTFGVKEKFIQFIVARSQRTGGIHPADLIRFLLVMDSGVRNKDLANIIASEYSQALIAEQQKAKELGLNIVYPIYPYPQTQNTTTAAFIQPYTGAQTQQYPPYQRYPQIQQLQQQQHVFDPIRLKEEIMMTIKAMLEEKEEKKKVELLEEQIQKTREDMIKIQHSFESALKDVVSTLTDKLKDIVEKVKEPPPNVVTVEQLEKMQLNKQLELLEKLLEEKDKRIQELVKELKEERSEMTEALQKVLDEYEKERAELLKKIEEVRSQQPISTEGFKSDEARVLATAIDRATQIIAQKKPVEVIIKTIPTLLGTPAPSTERPQYVETKESKSKVIELLEGTEYVSEE